MIATTRNTTRHRTVTVKATETALRNAVAAQYFAAARASVWGLGEGSDSIHERWAQEAIRAADIFIATLREREAAQ